MSPQELKKSFAGRLLIDEGGQDDIYVLLYQDSAVDNEEAYIFYKNKLAKVTFTPPVTNDQLAFYIGLYNGLVESITKIYGEPLSNTATYDIDKLEEVSLTAGEYYMSVWKSDGTKTIVLLRATNQGYTANFQFVDMSIEDQLNAALAAMK